MLKSVFGCILKIYSEGSPTRLQLMLFLGLLPRRREVYNMRKPHSVVRGAGQQFTGGKVVTVHHKAKIVLGHDDHLPSLL